MRDYFQKQQLREFTHRATGIGANMRRHAAQVKMDRLTALAAIYDEDMRNAVNCDRDIITNITDVYLAKVSNFMAAFQG